MALNLFCGTLKTLSHLRCVTGGVCVMRLISLSRTHWLPARLPSRLPAAGCVREFMCSPAALGPFISVAAAATACKCAET